MITECQKIEIKKILGNRYTADIIDVLNARGVLNLKGEPFSASYIRGVLNGTSNNLLIENIIFELCNKKKKEQTKLFNKRKKMLS